MPRFHFLFPDLLGFQNILEAAVAMLQASAIQRIPFYVTKDVKPHLTESAIHSPTPKVGVMVSQPAREKARSIEHCCQIMRSRPMSVERKYGGKYYQIYTDLAKSTLPRRRYRQPNSIIPCLVDKISTQPLSRPASSVI
jgi:DNA ligase-4